MDEILKQLVELLTGSVPTVVIFVLLAFAYQQLVHAPLMSVLAERRARTTGAVEKARAAIATAETRTAVYEQKMREARVAVMKAREQRLLQWQHEREAALETARQAAQQQVATAVDDIQKSAEQARKQIKAMAAELAVQVAEAVLPSSSTAKGAQ